MMPAKKKEKLIIQSISQQAPTRKFAEVVYFLHKEVGLTYKDVYGGKEVVMYEEMLERPGRLGSLLDYVFGRERVRRPRVIKNPGMNVKTFVTFLKLMNKDAEEQQKRAKNQGVRSDLRTETLGGGG